jgi:hypothetical protein
MRQALLRGATKALLDHEICRTYISWRVHFRASSNRGRCEFSLSEQVEICIDLPDVMQDGRPAPHVVLLRTLLGSTGVVDRRGVGHLM